jgi:hypothetical protein
MHACALVPCTCTGLPPCECLKVLLTGWTAAGCTNCGSLLDMPYLTSAFCSKGSASLHTYAPLYFPVLPPCLAFPCCLLQAIVGGGLALGWGGVTWLLTQQASNKSALLASHADLQYLPMAQQGPVVGDWPPFAHCRSSTCCVVVVM